MAVRAAKFADIPAIVEIYRQGHGRSIYAGKTTFDVQEAKQMMVRSIQRHGHENNGGTLVLVSETDGMVKGFIIGMLDNVYPCVKELMATDLLFIMGEDADASDARKMIKCLLAWAEGNQKVIEVHLGVTSAIGDWQRTAKFYERLGLSQCGAMFRRGFDR